MLGRVDWHVARPPESPGPSVACRTRRSDADHTPSTYEEQSHLDRRAGGSSAAAGIVGDRRRRDRPPVNDFTLDEGETWTETITVNLPAGTTVDAVDIYLLADTTGSMGGPINSVRAGARSIVENLGTEFPGVSLAFGVGDFKDFQSPSQGDPYAFRHALSITDDIDAVESAINGWSASGGNDGPEGQFYAYDQIARNRAPSADGSPAGSIGWRPGAKRVLVTFADAPAHDPVCAAITGVVDGHEVDYDITEASVISQFNAAGITFIGVSTTSGFGDAMDATQSFAGDYTSACGSEISSGSQAGGQATRIAAATGGAHILGVNSAAIVDVIADAISTAIATILSLSLTPEGEIVPFVAGIAPASHGPIDTEEPSSWVFEVDWEGVVAAAEEDQVFTGRLNVIADGSVLAFKPVTITVPGTGAEGVYPPVPEEVVPETEVLGEVLEQEDDEESDTRTRVIGEAQTAVPITARPDFTG